MQRVALLLCRDAAPFLEAAPKAAATRPGSEGNKRMPAHPKSRGKAAIVWLWPRLQISARVRKGRKWWLDVGDQSLLA